MSDTGFLRMSEESKNRVLLGIDWLVRGAVVWVAVTFQIYQSNLDDKFKRQREESDRILAQLTAQQTALDVLVQFAAEGERFTHRDGQNLQLWVENYVAKNVPPEEVKNRLSALEGEARELRLNQTEMRVELREISTRPGKP